jgi:hypothetical protein
MPSAQSLLTDLEAKGNRTHGWLMCGAGYPPIGSSASACGAAVHVQAGRPRYKHVQAGRPHHRFANEPRRRIAVVD